ncbi:MAG: leucine-rich repeat domain-containing protein, partial [Promethearchaeota archaeon]
DSPETHILGRLGIIGAKRGYLIRLVSKFMQYGNELKENDLKDLINESENFKTVRSSGIIKERWGRLAPVFVLDTLFRPQLEHMVELAGELPKESVITPTITTAPAKTKEQRVFQTKLVNISEIEILKQIQREIGSIIESHQFETNDEGNVRSIDLSSLTLKTVPKSIFSLPNLESINFSDDSFETDENLSNLMYDGKIVKIGGNKYLEGQIRGRIENNDAIKQGEANLKIGQLYKAIKWFEQSKELCTKFGWENGINYAEKMISEIKKQRKEQEKTLARKKAEQEEKRIIPILRQTLQNKIHSTIKDLSDEIKVHPEILQIYLEKIAITHKDSDQYWIKPEEYPESLVSFRNSQILYFQAEILKEIEQYIRRETNKELVFRLVDKIEHDTQMGFIVQDNQITGIGLYNCEMTKLPEALGFLYSLRVLGLSDNNLMNFPDSFKQLSILKVLILDYNSFETIPSIISNLTMLQELYLRYNKLYNLPDSIRNLKTLRRLDLDNNKISIISPESIENLVSLRDLRVSNNQLNNLPESIGHLKSIELLKLNNNPLVNLPKAIVNLKSLKFLYLKGTKITQIPKNLQDLKQKGKLSIYI